MNHFGLFSPKYTLHKIKCHTIFSRNFHYNKTELQNPIMINPRVKRFPVFVYLEWKLTHISLWKIMIYVTVSFFSFCNLYPRLPSVWGQTQYQTPVWQLRSLLPLQMMLAWSICRMSLCANSDYSGGTRLFRNFQESKKH